MIRALLAFCLAALVLAGPARGHEQRLAATEIVFNAQTGTMDIMHRFSLHDAEHAVSLRDGLRVDLIEDAEAQAAFARYVADRFTITLASGEPVELNLLGAEVEDGVIWVYQDASLPQAQPDALIVTAGALRDIWPDQSNFIYLRWGDYTVSGLLEGNARQLSLALTG